VAEEILEDERRQADRRRHRKDAGRQQVERRDQRPQEEREQDEVHGQDDNSDP
jgi:hypothetical protein